MPEITKTSLSIRPDQKDRLKELAENDDPRIDDMSEAVRHLIDEAERVDDLEDEIADLKMEIESLRNEKRVLIDERRDEQQETSDETALDTVDDDDSSIIDRLSWLLRG
jgi:TolA-binding protein